MASTNGCMSPPATLRAPVWTPKPWATAAATNGTAPALTARRWSAIPPVIVIVDSTTYIRDIEPRSSTRREAAYSRLFQTEFGSSAARKSPSNETTTWASENRMSGRAGWPRACCVPSAWGSSRVGPRVIHSAPVAAT